MFIWMKKMEWGKMLLVASIFTVVSMILHQVEAIITMQYYQMPEFNGVWSKLMMPTEGPPPMEFFISSLVLTFATGISLACIYYYMRDMLPKKFWKRVTYFADIMIATSFIFFTLPSYLMFNLPWQLLVSWFVSGFIIQTVAAFALVKLLK